MQAMHNREIMQVSVNQHSWFGSIHRISIGRVLTNVVDRRPQRHCLEFHFVIWLYCELSKEFFKYMPFTIAFADPKNKTISINHVPSLLARIESPWLKIKVTVRQQNHISAVSIKGCTWRSSGSARRKMVDGKKTFTWEELSCLNSEKNAHVAVQGKV